VLKSLLLFMILWLFSACEEKATPVITKSPNLTPPLNCLSLNSIDLDSEFNSTLQELYRFDPKCHWHLSVSYKRNIVCNSSYNAMSKNMGKFPKSFIKLEVRRGMEPLYSYYVDLYHNANREDLVMGMEQLKKDLLSK